MFGNGISPGTAPSIIIIPDVQYHIAINIYLYVIYIMFFLISIGVGDRNDDDDGDDDDDDDGLCVDNKRVIPCYLIRTLLVSGTAAASPWPR